MAIRETNYWTDDLIEPFHLPAMDTFPEDADVAVIGSGYTGLNAALALAKAGAKVLILEEHTIGWGASSRNGGMILPGYHSSMKEIVGRYGLAMARRLWQWSMDAMRYLEGIITQEAIDCHYQKTGQAYLAHKAAHLKRFESEVAFMESLFNYHDMELVGLSDLSDEIGTTAYFGAITEESAVAVHPAKYTLGLAEAVAGHGARMIEHCRVNVLRPRRHGFELHTAKGILKTRDVLVATNGYMGGWLPHIRRGLFPVGSYIIATEPIPKDLQSELSPKGRMFYDSKRLLNYFRLTPDGRMLFGGRPTFGTDLDPKISARRLGMQMVRVFPQLKDARITHSWSGRIGVTFDLMPHSGRFKGIHFACGYCGHGIAIASYLGYQMGLWLAGKPFDNPFMSEEYPRYAIAKHESIFLPFVSACYRLLDMLN